jgi:hypothetical protein
MVVVLQHCLMKRHRVDYGIHRVEGRKRMAVPFRASDTPSERSEFGHMDCALVRSLQLPSLATHILHSLRR